MKALMIRKLRRYDAIHSVAELLRRLRGSVEVPEELIKRSESLDRFYIPTRYPQRVTLWGASPALHQGGCAASA